MLPADFRRVARRGLRGRWAVSVIVTAVAALLGGLVAGDGVNHANRASGNGGASMSLDLSAGSLVFQVGELSFGISPETWPSLMELWGAVMGLITVIVIVYALVTLLIGGAVELGLCNYYINLIQGREQRPFDMLFGRFHIFGRAFLLRFVTGLMIFLWSLLFIIPGVIAAYRYSMASYIMAQDPDIGPLDAIRRSAAMMDGNKLRLFFLQISFIGWMLLSSLTLGAGCLFLWPYTQAAYAAFYLDAKAGNA